MRWPRRGIGAPMLYSHIPRGNSHREVGGSDWEGTTRRLSWTETSGLERCPLGCSHPPGVSIGAPRGGSHLPLSASALCIFQVGLQVDSFCLCHRGTWLLVSLHFSPRAIFLFVHSFVQEIVHAGLLCVRLRSPSWALS